MRRTTSPIAAVLVHVPDWRAGLEWYARAFPSAMRLVAEPGVDWQCLAIDGVQIEVVPADEKVSAGPAGTVVYWFTDDFDARVRHLESLGATLYRGPLQIEDGQLMCQLKDPFGNLIGIRGKRKEQAPDPSSGSENGD